ncbi:hypothetical protein QP185_08005 [Sphingomonas aerolata]
MKHGMRNYAPWHFSMGAFGECLPYADNHVSLHASKVDRFGVPLLRFDVRFHDNELKMMADARAQGEAMLLRCRADQRQEFGTGARSRRRDPRDGRRAHGS